MSGSGRIRTGCLPSFSRTLYQMSYRPVWTEPVSNRLPSELQSDALPDELPVRFYNNSHNMNTALTYRYGAQSCVHAWTTPWSQKPSPRLLSEKAG